MENNMERFVLVVMLLLSSHIANADSGILSDEKVNQFILIQNNYTKCFHPDIWNAKTEQDVNNIISEKSEDEQYRLFEDSSILMKDIFGETTTSEIQENNMLGKEFAEKYQRLYNKKSSINSLQDCQSIEGYFSRIRKIYK